MTVPCGVTREAVPLLKRGERLTGVASRGGALHLDWMIQHDKENPLYEKFDEVLKIARTYDVVLSLGDGLRPGCLADASDALQFLELVTVGGLVERAWGAGVQVMAEGPGHVPLDETEVQVRLAKALCDGAPFYVLGPLPTDIAAGYDHIAALVSGVLAARMAAHIVDIVKLPRSRQRDDEMAQARGRLFWKEMVKFAIDPEIFRQRKEAPTEGPFVLCGILCPMSTRRLCQELWAYLTNPELFSPSRATSSNDPFPWFFSSSFSPGRGEGEDEGPPSLQPSSPRERRIGKRPQWVFRQAQELLTGKEENEPKGGES